jgi:hypothetical protein
LPSSANYSPSSTPCSGTTDNGKRLTRMVSDGYTVPPYRIHRRAI